MVNYQNGKIYKLWSPSKNITYIGSTTQLLCKRLVVHLSHYKAYNKDNTKLYLTSFLVLECEDYKIELLEEYACNNKQQLEKKEGEYIRNYDCCNKHIVGRTQKEYNEDNKEKLLEYIKQYKTDNADRLKAYRKQYNKDNADKRKEYRINNADRIKEHDRQRYLKKKLEIKE